MVKKNAMVECLARYSKSSLALMIFDNSDNSEKLPRAIWKIAGRARILAVVADNENLDGVLQAAKQSRYDAILYRLIENLSDRNRSLLNDEMVGMDSAQKGKFIFTTNDFEIFDREFMRLVCRMKYRIDVEDEPAPGDFRQSAEIEAQWMAGGLIL